jgi:hypothetical protein
MASRLPCRPGRLGRRYMLVTIPSHPNFASRMYPMLLKLRNSAEVPANWWQVAIYLEIAWIGLRDAVCLVYEILGAWPQLWMRVSSMGCTHIAMVSGSNLLAGPTSDSVDILFMKDCLRPCAGSRMRRPYRDQEYGAYMISMHRWGSMGSHRSRRIASNCSETRPSHGR